MSIHYDLANDKKLSLSKALINYIIGFILCIILTCASFYVAYFHVLKSESLFLVLSALAIIQLIFQVIFFLRLNTHNEEAKWDFISFLFTVFVVVVVVGGSLWIMYNLNYYMVH